MAIIDDMGKGSGSGNIDSAGNLGGMGMPPALGDPARPDGQVPYPPKMPAQSPGQVSDVLPGQYRWPGTVPSAS